MFRCTIFLDAVVKRNHFTAFFLLQALLLMLFITFVISNSETFLINLLNSASII